MNDEERSAINELEAIANKIKTNREARLELQKLFDQKTEDLRRIEQRLFAKVSAEPDPNDPDGKKKLYTNDKLREAATADAMRSDAEAYAARKLLGEALDALKKNEIETDYAEMKYKNYHARVRLLTTERHVTAVDFGK